MKVITRFAFLLVLAVPLFTACAAGGERVAGTSSPVLTQEDMAPLVGSNLYEVIDRMRPRWLQVRHSMSMGAGTGQIVVFMNNSYLGGPDQLRQFSPRDVTEVRYLDGPQAAATLRGYDNTLHVVGAIVMVTATR
jgi:hypothetical protein